jgi:phosphomannomutase
LPAVLGTAAGLPALPIDHHPLYFDLDGSTQPRGQPARGRRTSSTCGGRRTCGADLGLAFDGDADRCFVVDEKGDAVTPSAVAPRRRAAEITRVRAAAGGDIFVIHNLITSNIVARDHRGCRR